MANTEDIDRAKLGREVWNEWARVEIAEGRKTDVDFSGAVLVQDDFSHFVFPGRARFEDTTFPYYTKFIRAQFSGHVSFFGAKFTAIGQFDNATFSAGATFNRTEFPKEGSFESVRFPNVAFSHAKFGRASFMGAEFHSVTTFEAVIINEAAEFRHTRFHERCIFDGALLTDADFHAARFSKQASFARSRLATKTSFSSAVFSGPAIFADSAFSGPASFQEATFTDAIDCRRSIFESTVFDGSKFGGQINRFSGARFSRVPDFRMTTFAHPPDFHAATIDYATDKNAWWWRRMLNCALEPEDTARYRRLKQLATEAKDHERELQFFSLELRAKRFHETTGLGPIALNACYDWFSEFGRSLARPMIALVLLTIASSGVISFACWTRWEAVGQTIGGSLVLGLSNIALLFGSERWSMRVKAFSMLGTENGFGLLGDALAYGQSAASLFLVFLIGLALRNRFRIGSAP